MNPLSVQERFAKNSICFGCGPANKQGLQIRSLETDHPHTLSAVFDPAPYHQAFPGVLNGGIIGSLLDCHSNWTAAICLKNDQALQEPPCTVTAEFHVKLLRPTPAHQTCYLRAEGVEILGDRVWVEATLTSGGKVCATCRGLFVAVKEGHPAYHRWSSA